MEQNLTEAFSPNLQPDPVHMAITIFVPAITKVRWLVTWFRFVSLGTGDEFVVKPFDKPSNVGEVII